MYLSVVFSIISKIRKLLKFPKTRRMRDQRRKHFTKSSLLQHPIKYLSPEDTLYLWYSTIKYPWEKMPIIKPLENTVSLTRVLFTVNDLDWQFIPLSEPRNGCIDKFYFRWSQIALSSCGKRYQILLCPII